MEKKDKINLRTIQNLMLQLHTSIVYDSLNATYFQIVVTDSSSLSLLFNTPLFFAAFISLQPPKNSPPMKIRGTLLKI